MNPFPYFATPWWEIDATSLNSYPTGDMSLQKLSAVKDSEMMGMYKQNERCMKSKSRRTRVME